MNTKYFITYFLFFALSVMGCGEEKSADDHNHATAQELYTCGMHPQIVQEGPGLCPICEMELTPLNQSTDGEGVVSIDPVTLQNIGVKTATVSVTSLQQSVQAPGTITLNERGQTMVSPKIGGWVEKLYIDYEGARVGKGQKLLEIYSPELVAAQEEYLLAFRNATRLKDAPIAEDAQRILEATRRKLDYWDITSSQVEALHQSGKTQRTVTLYAPASGTVTQKMVVEGQQIMAGQSVMELTDLSQVWLMIDIYEQDLSWVKVGTQAKISLPYDPTFEGGGQVDYLYDELNPQTRTVKARIPLKNSGRSFKPGMYAVATILGTATAPTPVVPTEAVLRDGKSTFVVLALGEGKFKPQSVTLGLETDSLTQIVSGLQEGDEVVTSAQFLIDSEAQLQSAVRSMTATTENDSMKEMLVDVYKADENKDNKVFICSSDPYLITDKKAMITSCTGSIKEVRLDVAQTVLHYDGYKNVPVNASRADHNHDGHVYQCPMDWAILQDEMGNCPVCNMRLERYSLKQAIENLKREGYRVQEDN